MTKPARKNVAKPKTSRKTKLAIAEVASKNNTKSATVLAMLESKSGTSVSEIVASTGWQNHSVRGFLSGTVKKKLGHAIASEVIDGERRYRIAG